MRPKVFYRRKRYDFFKFVAAEKKTEQRRYQTEILQLVFDLPIGSFKQTNKKDISCRVCLSANKKLNFDQFWLKVWILNEKLYHPY